MGKKQDMRALAAGVFPVSQDFRLPAVDRAISLFELPANSKQGLTLSEMSRKLSIPKSTMHCLIHTLATRGYVQQSADSRHYLLGLRFADLAIASLAQLNLRKTVARGSAKSRRASGLPRLRRCSGALKR